MQIAVKIRIKRGINNSVEMVDIRTQHEKERDARHESICQMFLDWSNEHPELAPHRIMSVIANQYKMSVPGIKSIIVRNGLYQCNQGKNGSKKD